MTLWKAFLWGKLAAFWTTFLTRHFAEVCMRTANKDNSQLNQYLFKIPADFPTQCSDACLALHCEKTSRTSTARFRTMHQRHRSCHWEATLAGYNFPSEFPDTQATAVSNKVSVVLPATLKNTYQLRAIMLLNFVHPESHNDRNKVEITSIKFIPVHSIRLFYT